MNAPRGKVSMLFIAHKVPKNPKIDRHVELQRSSTVAPLSPLKMNTELPSSEEPAPAQEPRRLFDLGDSEGVNESERALTRLCRRSFLRLWSQTNVFTDEGFKDGKGATKELSDALVVFGDDVIIFSDKHVKFQVEREMQVAWPRWYKRAVLESCKQLHGAKSWLSRFPERAFLDAKCNRKLPISVPTGPDVHFHLIAVTRGSREAALAYNRGEGLGSFGVNSALEGEAVARQSG